MRYGLLFSLLLLQTLGVFARDLSSETSPRVKQMGYEISVFNNGTFMPGKGTLGIWSPSLHPGIAVGKHFQLIYGKKYRLYQTAKLGYFYHQNAQHGIQAYTELAYRYKFLPDWYAEPRLGLGYLMSIPAMQMFEFKDGVYQKQAFRGRHQFMGGLALNIGYSFQGKLKVPLDVFAGYQFWVQSPFVNKYVPVLPNNTVQIGSVYYFNKTIK